MNHVVELRDLAIAVGQYRKTDARGLRLVDVLDPLDVRFGGIDRQRDRLDIALLEFARELRRQAEFRRADGREIRWMRKEHTPTVAQPFVKLDAADARCLLEIGCDVAKT